MSARRCGVLLHPTSLPAAGGLGPDAERWLDWLAAAGQGLWQMLPVGPPGPWGSPYDSPSSFAGHTGLLGRGGDGSDHAAGGPQRPGERSEREPRTDFEAFAATEGPRWLDDWALYTALHERYGAGWPEWPEPLRRRRAAALAAARRELATAVEAERLAQFRFARRWRELRRYAAGRGVALVGDLPFYPAADSADVWAHQELFELDAAGRPLAVGGVPPDAYSAAGQLWGNPVYRWPAMAEAGYGWWIDRLAAALERFDLVRVDHFRGYEAAWVIPADGEAQHGEWVEGPGAAPFEAARAALGELPLLAEDLGHITAPVRRLRRRLGLPGTRVLQFGFEGDEEHLPHRFTPDLAVYTATHDSDTSRGWYAGLEEAARRRVRDYLGETGDGVHRALIRAAWTSAAALAVTPLQDLLGLGSEARMNTPGVAGGNWRWRFRWRELGDEPGEWLLETSRAAGRRPAAGEAPRAGGADDQAVADPGSAPSPARAASSSADAAPASATDQTRHS